MSEPYTPEWMAARTAMPQQQMRPEYTDEHGFLFLGVVEFLEAARSGPECFKCREAITEFNDVRVITIRVDGEPKDVWVHADHAKPDWVAVSVEGL